MMKVSFNGKSYEYEAEKMFLDLSKPISRADAVKTLFLAKEISEKNNVVMSLAFGTLLGAIREKDFIKNDFDIDVFTKDEDKLFDCLKDFESNGLKLVRALPGEVYSFRYSANCYIDFYILREIKGSIWSLWCYSLTNYYEPKYLFKGYEEIPFLEKNFLCPKNPLKLIKWWYGKDWDKPADKNSYYSHYEVFSHQLIKNPRLAFKWLFRRLIGNKMYLELKNSLK